MVLLPPLHPKSIKMHARPTVSGIRETRFECRKFRGDIDIVSANVTACSRSAGANRGDFRTPVILYVLSRNHLHNSDLSSIRGRHKLSSPLSSCILRTTPVTRHDIKLLLILTLFLAPPAYAYIGPGAGLTAIGTVIALVGAVLLAIVGFVWYPIKRLKAKLAKNKAQDEDEERDKAESPEQDA